MRSYPSPLVQQVVRCVIADHPSLSLSPVYAHATAFLSLSLSPAKGDGEAHALADQDNDGSLLTWVAAAGNKGR